MATMAVLGAAAFVHLVRYMLLIVNRTILLNPWVAGAATWGGVAVSVVAVFMVVASALLLTNWLIARRAAAFAHRGEPEPGRRGRCAAGCLVPLVKPAVGAGVRHRAGRCRGPTALAAPADRVWWLVWVASTAVSIFSIATSFTTDPQGIADNTVTTIVAYLLALAAVLLALQVFLGFERQPVERPARRWVVVADNSARRGSPSNPSASASAVEPEGQEPGSIAV